MRNNKNYLASLYLNFDRDQLLNLYKYDSINSLKNNELFKINDIDHPISPEEIDKIFLPISSLLKLNINVFLYKRNTLNNFLKIQDYKIPYIIGITGSIAVGKTTTAQLLKVLLTNYHNYRNVVIITTDGFLYPNKILISRGIMKKKGFPQSYDIEKLVKFMYEIKSGVDTISIPKYSHDFYDIIPNQQQIVKRPDILILEGLNILQHNSNLSKKLHHIFVSDFIDFSIYIDAKEKLLKVWYIERFLKFWKNSFSNSDSYFYRYSKYKKTEIIKIAQLIWKKINMVNLQKNIIPTKKRANLIITKGYNHSIIDMKLRK